MEPEVFEKIGFDRFDYSIGFLNGIEAIGLIKLKIHKGAIVPVSCAEVVVDETKPNLLNVLKVASPKDSERLRNLMTAIEAHLA